MQNKEAKVVLAVSSEVGVGSVGLSIARFVFAKNNVEAISLPTIVLASRPDLGKMAGHAIPAESLSLQLSALEEDGWLSRLDGVTTGYFANAEQVEVMAGLIARVRAVNPDAIILVDPVLGDSDTGVYVLQGVAEAVRDKLVPLADIITPNLFEFSWLAGAENLSIDDILSQSTRLDVPSIVVTSAHIETGSAQKIQTALVHITKKKSELSVFSSPYIQVMPKGTGDVFASRLLSCLVQGEEIKSAVNESVVFLEKIAKKAEGMSSIPPFILM